MRTSTEFINIRGKTYNLAHGNRQRTGISSSRAHPQILEHGNRPSAWRGWRWRRYRPPRCDRRSTDGAQVDLRHRHADLPQHRIGQFVVTVEAAADSAAPDRHAAIRMKLERRLARIQRR